MFVLGIDAPKFTARHELAAGTILSEALVGFRTIARESSLRVLVGLFTAQTFVAGAVQVFLVVTAIELLDLGEQGVGYLNSAVGLGALAGGILALSLTGARRLSPAFMLGVVLWGLPLVVLGLWQPIAGALVLFALLGIGNSLVDVAAFTLVQRAVPDEILARVFGVIQMLWLASVGIGAVLAPVLIDALGLEGALIATGVFLPVLVLLLGRASSRSTRSPPRRTRRHCGSSARRRSSRRCRAGRSSTWRRGSYRSASRRERPSCAKAMPATASTSSSTARSTCPRTARSSRSSLPADTSARSRSFATSHAPRPSRLEPTLFSTPSTARTSSPPSPDTRRAPKRPSP